MEQCRVCHWEGNAEKLVAREMMQGRGDSFTYFVCPHCNSLQIAEIPVELGKYYGKGYYSYSRPDCSIEIIQERNTTRILDVGCGAGALLCHLAKQGYTQLYGCDPFIEEDIFYENGVKIYKKTINEIQGEFDWIFFNDSFEHITDPHDVLDSACRLLAPRGVLKINMPVFPNIAFDMFSTYWFQLDAPRHIILHSRKSMEYLAQLHGLSIQKVEYNSNMSQFIRSFLYMKGISYNEQTSELIRQFFSESDIKEMDQNAVTANKNGYGDHAAFYLMKGSP